MAVSAKKANRPSQRSRRLGAALFALAAVGSSVMVAAWIAETDFSPLASAALPANPDRTTFEDRFTPASRSVGGASMQPKTRFALARVETESAQAALALRWPQDFRGAIADDEPRVDEQRLVVTKPLAPADGIPLPRSRPSAADQPGLASQALALASTMPTTTPTESLLPRPAERSMLQKFSDMVKTRVTLASLGLGKGPDLTSLGYDNETAVYDITAHAVYLPNGTVLEAHSGTGSLRDDPDHVSVPNLGATPPATYALKPRESMFHGVAALRMIPAEGSDISGRSGLLVHSFMLGPNGDSNGCVSVKDYDRFLRAFNDGQFSHIAVVTSVKAMILAQQNGD
jgi:hypothetical protein